MNGDENDIISGGVSVLVSDSSPMPRSMLYNNFMQQLFYASFSDEKKLSRNIKVKNSFKKCVVSTVINFEEFSASNYFSNFDQNNNEKYLIKRQSTNLFEDIIFIKAFEKGTDILKKIFTKSNVEEGVLYYYIGSRLRLKDNAKLMYFSNDYFETDLKDILDMIGKDSILLVDRDYSGALLKPLQDYKKNNSDCNVMGFFSCSEDQEMCHSKEFPIDIFSASMSYPVRMMVAVQSKLYYCFEGSDLHSISAFSLSPLTEEHDNSKYNKLFEESYAAIRALIEAMAFRRFKRELYFELFKKEEFVAKLVTNFILTCRVMRYFRISPVSTIDFPDLNDEPEWQTITLVLDNILVNFSNPELAFKLPCFLEHSFKSLLPLIAIHKEIIPTELFLLPHMFRYCRKCSFSILAEVLDTKIEWIVYMMTHDFLNNIVKLITEDLDNSLFCLVKILSYSQDLRNTIKDVLYDILDRVIYPEFNRKNTIRTELSMILLFLLVDDSPEISNLMIKKVDIHKVLFNEHYLLWSFQLISSFAPFCKMESKKSLFDTVESVDSKCNIYLKYPFVNALSSLLKNKVFTVLSFCDSAEEFPDIVLRKALSFCDSLSSLVRKEVLITISRYINDYKKVDDINTELLKSLLSFVEACVNDPYPDIAKIAQEINKYLTEGENVKLTFDTNLVPKYRNILAYSQIINAVKENKPLLQILNGLKGESKATCFDVKSETKSSEKSRKVRQKFAYQHTSPITSQIDYFNKKIVFGDYSGYIVYRYFDSNNYTLKKISKNPIFSVKIVENDYIPLIFSTSDKHVLINSFNDQQLMNTFYVNDFESLDPITVDVERWSKLIFTYQKKCSDMVTVRDFERDKVLDPIYSFDKKSIYGLSLQSRDCVVIASDYFSIFDTRINEHVINHKYNVFDVDYIDDKLYILCNRNVGICTLDIRNPDRRVYSAFSENHHASSTLCFSFNRLNRLYALGHTRGLLVSDPTSNTQNLFTDQQNFTASNLLMSPNDLVVATTSGSLKIYSV